jgi:hypothetical protein
MRYYWNVMALTVGAALCLCLGRTLFDPSPEATARSPRPGPERVLHADAGHPPNAHK